jgi:hypothetical protein
MLRPRLTTRRARVCSASSAGDMPKSLLNSRLNMRFSDRILAAVCARCHAIKLAHSAFLPQVAQTPREVAGLLEDWSFPFLGSAP